MSSDFRFERSRLHTASVVFLLALLAVVVTACNITKRGEKGKEQVDIETPVGSIHVNKDLKASDTGLPEYPAAKTAAESPDSKSATVNIDTSKFGLKVVAVKFETDDSPDKVLDFYRHKMKSMGPVSECHGSFDLDVKNKGEQHEIRCEEKPDQTELMVGEKNRHRAVKVMPSGKGSRFELLYVESRGERETL
jgi:hypothetical protein